MPLGVGRAVCHTDGAVGIAVEPVEQFHEIKRRTRTGAQRIPEYER